MPVLLEMVRASSSFLFILLKNGSVWVLSLNTSLSEGNQSADGGLWLGHEILLPELCEKNGKKGSRIILAKFSYPKSSPNWKIICSPFRVSRNFLNIYFEGSLQAGI